MLAVLSRIYIFLQLLNGNLKATFLNIFFISSYSWFIFFSQVLKEKLKKLTGNDAVDEIFGQLIDVLNKSKSIVQKIIGIQTEDVVDDKDGMIQDDIGKAVDGFVDSKTYVNITNVDSGFGVEISANGGSLVKSKTQSPPSPPSIGSVVMPDDNRSNNCEEEIGKVYYHEQTF